MNINTNDNKTGLLKGCSRKRMKMYLVLLIVAPRLYIYIYTFTGQLDTPRKLMAYNAIATAIVVLIFIYVFLTKNSSTKWRGSLNLRLCHFHFHFRRLLVCLPPRLPLRLQPRVLDQPGALTPRTQISRGKWAGPRWRWRWRQRRGLLPVGGTRRHGDAELRGWTRIRFLFALHV